MNDETHEIEEIPAGFVVIAARAALRVRASILSIIPFKRDVLVVYHRNDYYTAGIITIAARTIKIVTEQELEDRIRDLIHDNIHEIMLQSI